MQIKAVILDFGGVVCFHPNDQQIAELAGLCGVPIADFLRVFWGHRTAYDRGDFDAAQYWKAFADSTGRSYSAVQVSEFARRDSDFWSRIDTRVMEWARRVRASGARIALLSNLPADLGAQLYARPGFLAEFDHFTFSYEVRSVKPEARIYEHCVAGLGVAPSEALFLDDRIENVRGAQAVGIQAVLFESPQSLAGLAAQYQLPGFSDSDA